MTDHTSTQALSLRVQALALLQQAQQLDGLKPFLIHHSHQYGTTGYLVWGTEEPDEVTAAKLLDSEYEPDVNGHRIFPTRGNSNFPTRLGSVFVV